MVEILFGTSRDHHLRSNGPCERVTAKQSAQSLVDPVDVMVSNHAPAWTLPRLPVRRLDFLIQEITQEVNALSSKPQNLNTMRSTVDMKAIIEREQAQNVE